MLELVRDTPSPNSFLGRMSLGGLYLCDTLEDVDRSGEDHILQAPEKIYGQTCIPYGEYKVELVFWAKYGCKMPQIMDVPHFTGIFIHPGNTNLDTLGCVLTGTRGDKPDFIFNTRVVFFEKVLPRIHDWLDEKPLTLKITKAGGF